MNERATHLCHPCTQPHAGAHGDRRVICQGTLLSNLPQPEAHPHTDPAGEAHTPSGAATHDPEPSHSSTQIFNRTELQTGSEFDSTILPAPQAEPTPPAPPQVAEFLITTGRGDVIHEWQCPDPASS